MPDEYDLMIDAIHAVRQLRAVHGSGGGGIQPIDDAAANLRALAHGLPTIPGSAPLKMNKLALALADAIEAVYGSKQMP